MEELIFRISHCRSTIFSRLSRADGSRCEGRMAQSLLPRQRPHIGIGVRGGTSRGIMKRIQNLPAHDRSHPGVRSRPIGAHKRRGVVAKAVQRRVRVQENSAEWNTPDALQKRMQKFTKAAQPEGAEEWNAPDAIERRTKKFQS
jgi:hypothetical protein